MAQSFPVPFDAAPPPELTGPQHDTLSRSFLSMQEQSPQYDATSVQVGQDVSHRGSDKRMHWQMALRTLPEEDLPLPEEDLLSCLKEKKAQLGAMGDGVDGLDLCKIWSMLDLTVNQVLQLTRELRQERQCREVVESMVADRHRDLLDLWSALCRERSERESATDWLTARLAASEQKVLRLLADPEKEVNDSPHCMDVEAKQCEVLETFHEAQLLKSEECAEQIVCSNEQPIEQLLEQSLEQSGELGPLQTDMRSVASSERDALEQSAQVFDVKADSAINSILTAAEASPAPDAGRLPAKAENMTGFCPASDSPPLQTLVLTSEVLASGGGDEQKCPMEDSDASHPRSPSPFPSSPIIVRSFSAGSLPSADVVDAVATASQEAMAPAAERHMPFPLVRPGPSNVAANSQASLWACASAQSTQLVYTAHTVAGPAAAEAARATGARSPSANARRSTAVVVANSVRPAPTSRTMTPTSSAPAFIIPNGVASSPARGSFRTPCLTQAARQWRLSSTPGRPQRATSCTILPHGSGPGPERATSCTIPPHGSGPESTDNLVRRTYECHRSS